MWMLCNCVTRMPTGHDGIEDSGGFSGFPPRYPLYDQKPLSRLRVTHLKRVLQAGNLPALKTFCNLWPIGDHEGGRKNGCSQ
jgi:hypothetical protein